MIFALFMLCRQSVAQDQALEFKLGLSHQMALDTRYGSEYCGYGHPHFNGSDSVNAGFGLSAGFRYKLSDQFRVGLKIGYDYMYLYQDNVLDEWDWEYWEKTYIEFIPGLTVEEANRTLRYNAGTDSTLFSAVFEPTQRLKELKLATEVSYQIRVWEDISATVGLEFGASMFSRELRMNEHWIKRFKLDSASVEKFDYEYEFELLHFAPSKKGTRFFLAPAIGLSWDLGDTFLATFDWRFTQYLGRQHVGWLEDLFGIPADSEKWFPVKSKMQFELGLVFKY